MELEEFSLPSRVAGHDEGIGHDELQLAARNHGMPAEALRYDITPIGLHYLLVHYDIPDVDADHWTLRIGGAVGHPLSLSLADLRARPRVTMPVTLECAGNGRARLSPRPVSQPWLLDAVGTAEWTGTPLAPLLAEAGSHPDAVEVIFTGADHGAERGVEQDYQRALPIDAAARPEVLLVYEMNDVPLPPQHGAPCRLIAPGWYGMAQVKWLRDVTVTEQPFHGFQNAAAYRFKQSAEDVGTPVTRILPRAAIQPPGHPDFQSRARFVRAGTHLDQGPGLVGRWTGHQSQCDRGRRPELAGRGSRTGAGPWAWRRWTWPWSVDRPGRYELSAVAEDESGQRQPLEPPWNRQGMANNMAQTVTVYVLESASDAS